MDAFEKMKLAAQAMRKAMPAFPGLFESSPVDLREGERYLQLGKHAEAERWFDRELANLKARGPMRARHARVLLGYATAQFRQAKYDDARETVETALELLEDAGQKRQPEVAACLDLLGGIFLEKGDFERARELFEQALAAEEAVRPRKSENLILRYRRLAGALRKADRNGEARTTLAKALKAVQETLGENHPVTAGTLLELGQCESALGEHAAALDHLKLALSYHKEASGPDSEEVAQCLQALASATQASGDLEASVGFYEQALRLRERQLGGNAADFAVLLMSLAGVHSHLGRYAPAAELLQQAVGKLQGVRDGRLGEALESLASIYLASGRPDDAVSNLRKAREVWEADPVANAKRLRDNRALLDRASAQLPPEEVLATAVPDDPGTSIWMPGPAAPALDLLQPGPQGAIQPAMGPVAEAPEADTFSVAEALVDPGAASPFSYAAPQAEPPEAGQAGADAGRRFSAAAPPAEQYPAPVPGTTSGSAVTGEGAPPPRNTAGVQTQGAATPSARPDGSPAPAPAGARPVPDKGASAAEAHETARLAASHVRRSDRAGERQPPAPPEPVQASSRNIAVLQGWDELGFDLLPM